jgi:hypothetical protein
MLLISVAGRGALATQLSKPRVLNVDNIAVYAKEHLKVELLRVGTSSNKWEFELLVRNEGEYAIFLMTEPVKTDGSVGPYVALAGDDQSTLEISSMVYALPPYTIYSDYSSVKLKYLSPHAQYRMPFTISNVMSESIPPYKDFPVAREISLYKVRFVRAFVGVLPDDEGIRDFLRRKEAIGPFTNGLEQIERGQYKGKRIIDLQVVITSQSIGLNN